jgi:hypothetical protein
VLTQGVAANTGPRSQNGSWCHWCGDSSFVPTARRYVEQVGEESVQREEVWLACHRCGHDHNTAPTQSTLRPVRTADPFNPARRHHRSRMDSMCPSVAWALLSNENLDDAYTTLTPFAERRDSGRPDIRRSLTFVNEENELVGRPFADVAPLLTGVGDILDYRVSLEHEVQAAATPDELLGQVDQLFTVLRFALAADDEFASPEVYDAGAKILGICVGCGAWPGETHWLSENPECPRDPVLLAPLPFWGRWGRLVNDGADSALRVRALTFAAARAIAGMAGLFELRSSDESDGRLVALSRIRKDRLSSERRRWNQALLQLPAATPAAQLPLFEVAQTQIDFVGDVRRRRTDQPEAHP